MEGAKDPDEYVIKYGSGRFNLLVENAISLIEFKAKMLKQQFNLENPNDKIKFLKQISKILSEVDNKIEQEIFIEKICEENGISKEAIYAEVNKLTYSNQTPQKLLKKPIMENKKEEEQISQAIIKRENIILFLLINNFNEFSEKIKNNITEDDFKVDINKKIFRKIFEINNEENLLKVLSSIEDEQFQSALSSIIVSDYELKSEEKLAEDIINNYIKERLNIRKNEIIKLIETNKDLSKDEIKAKEEELSQIIIQLAKMK